MTTTAIRKKLHDYIADASNSKVKGMYLLLEDELAKQNNFELSPEHIAILEEERTNHLQGISKSYTQQEASDFIRGNKQ